MFMAVSPGFKVHSGSLTDRFLDTDSDGIGNGADTDDDGDGVADSHNAFPLDASETVDTDSDGIGDNADPDDDGDGFSDEQEAIDESFEVAPLSFGLQL